MKNYDYPPLCHCFFWNYKKTNVNCIRKSLDSFKWDAAFAEKSINQQFEILNDNTQNVLSKWITINDNVLPCMAEEIKAKIKHKNNLSKVF